LGLLLEARSDAVPERNHAFVVVDSSLAVQAVSRAAELALGVRETEAVNRPVTEFLSPADAEAEPPGRLAASIVAAVNGDDSIRRVFVRPAITSGVRLRARIAACGPPRAALLLLDTPSIASTVPMVSPPSPADPARPAPRRRLRLRSAGLDGGASLLRPGSWPMVRTAVDLTMLYAASLVALSGADQTDAAVRNWWLAMLFPLLVLGLMRTGRSAGQRMQSSLVDNLAHVAGVVSLGAMATIAAGAILGGDRPVPTALRLWLFSLVYLGAARVALGTIERNGRIAGSLASPTLIVGAGEIGARVASRLRDRPEYGLRPVGFLDAAPPPAEPGAASAGPLLGGPDDLADVVEQTGARHVIVAFSYERDAQTLELVRKCQQLGLEVSVVPRLYEEINERAELDHVGGLPVLKLRPLNPKGWQFAVKYAIDRAVALIALVALAPLMLAIALAVRWDSPGPVLFRQRRVGRDGHAFDLLKFRTMSAGTVSQDFMPARGLAPGGVEGADRRTRLGRWLRTTSLDELPQLVNVLRGEMSLVGPRPERPEFARRFACEVHRYDDRHRVKSGITGWAQVSGLRGQTSIADRAEWDNHYIHNWSPWLDLRILALTVAEVVRGREPAGQPRTVDQTVTPVVDHQ
jgi:exopolysaccharide biosynthesis polyprenyl glycosylphosphotransferase